MITIHVKIAGWYKKKKRTFDFTCAIEPVEDLSACMQEYIEKEQALAIFKKTHPKLHDAFVYWGMRVPTK
jgi:hypothetical protein